MGILAGALGVILGNGCILLIKRGTEPHKGYWCLPGGVQEEGEPLDETARREALEETGVEVAVVQKLGKVKGPMTGSLHTLFLCSHKGGSLTPSPPETTDVRWIPHGELPNLLLPPFISEFLDSLDLHDLERRLSRIRPAFSR